MRQTYTNISSANTKITVIVRAQELNILNFCGLCRKFATKLNKGTTTKSACEGEVETHHRYLGSS